MIEILKRGTDYCLEKEFRSKNPRAKKKNRYKTKQGKKKKKTNKIIMKAL